MQQFQVPQFIDIEDKIIGPLTLKQFFYLLIGFGIAAILFRIFKGIIAVILGLPIAALSVAFAFLKINSRPLPVLAKGFIAYIFRPRLYVWKKAEPGKRVVEKTPMQEKSPPTVAPKITESKLQELAWSLDIKERI